MPRGAGEWLECAGRVAGILDCDPTDVEGRGAGDDDEEADDPGQQGADDDVDSLVEEILDLSAACRPRRTG